MTSPTLDLTPLNDASATLAEAYALWSEEKTGSKLKPHLRSAVIQSFEFTYEMAVRTLRKALMDRAESADLVTDLSFNDMLRKAADAGLIEDTNAWRRWRELRNNTSHSYQEAKAIEVVEAMPEFMSDVQALLAKLQSEGAN